MSMPHILVIDDESGISDALAYALRSEGMEVTVCATLGAARAAGADFDLAVLDVGLPDGNGFDFCKELRRRSSMPVIFLTARADEIDRVVGLEIGADDYVIKPFSPREVAARVKAVLRRARMPMASDASMAADGIFAIDAVRRQITYFGNPLTLSRYEFRILQALVE
jgi:two-component system catabolic regulation response regulator CreB